MNPKLHCSKHYIFWKIYRSPAVDWQEINRGMYNKVFILSTFRLVSIAKISHKSLYELTELSVFSPAAIPAFKLFLNKKIYFNLFP